MTFQSRATKAFFILLLTAIAGSAAAFELSNDIWPTNQFPIPYLINTSNAPAEFESLVRNAMTEWHSVPGSDLTTRFIATTSRSLSNTDGLNIFYWLTDVSELPFWPDPSVLALTLVRTNEDGIVEVDVLINGSEEINWCVSGIPEEGEYDLYTVLLRETGRWAGLAYTTNPAYSSSVMYHELQPEETRRVLTQDDIDGISAAYPAAYSEDAYEPGDNTPAGATELLFDQPQDDHSIVPHNDVDWYVFTLTETTSIRISTTGEDPLGNTELFLYHSSNLTTEIAHNDIPFDPEPGYPYYATIDMPGLAGGTYYVMARSSAAAGSPLIAQYTIALTSGLVDAYEPDDDQLFARRIYPDEIQNRSLSPAFDIDWAYFILSEPSHVVIETDSIDHPIGDTALALWSTSAEIAQNIDKSFDSNYSRIEATLEAGKYFILVKANWDGDVIPSYTLELHATPAVGDIYEPDNDPTEAKELPLGVAQNRSIKPVGDVDWLYVVLNDTATSFTITLDGPMGHDTLLEMFTDDVYYDELVQPIAVDDNSGIGNYSKITMSGLSAGTYYFRITQKDGTAEIPSYQVIATAMFGADQYEPNNTPEQATPIAINEIQQHSIHPATDEDWLTFVLPASGDLIVTTFGSNPDPWLEMYVYYEDPYGWPDYNDGVSWNGWYPEVFIGSAPAGTYYVMITSITDTIEDEYFVQVLFDGAEGDSHEPDNTPAEATLLTSGVPSTQHSIFPVGDIDWFKIIAGEGSWDLLIEIETDPNSPLQVRLYDDSVETVDPSTVTPTAQHVQYGSFQLQQLDLESGTYYISVNRLGNNNTVDDYSLKATLTPGAAFRTAPRSLHFSGNWVNPPVAADLSVRHSEETVNWTSPAHPWIILTPSSGVVGPDAFHEIQVSIDMQHFVDAGLYSDTITLTAQDSENSTANLEVSVEVTSSAADITWDKLLLNFEGIEGTISPQPVEVTFTNEGGGTNIPWTIEVVDENDDPLPWVIVQPDSGTMYSGSPSQLLSVSIQPDGLPPATHTAYIALRGFEHSPGDPPAKPAVELVLNEDTVPPAPLNTTFEVPPHGLPGERKMSMTAVETVDDQGGPVQYYFEFVDGDVASVHSGWISERTFVTPDLAPGGYYTYRVRARDTSSNLNTTNFSAPASGYTAPAAPAAPVVTSPTYSSVQITPVLGDNSQRVLLAIYNVNDGVYVDRHGAPVAEPVWRVINDWNTIEAVELTGSTEYQFRTIAMNAQGVLSDFSPAATITTLDNMPPSPAPEFAPGSPAITGNTITMTSTLSDDASGPVEYKFEYVGPETDGSDSDWQESRTYSQTVGTPGGEYSYVIIARDALGNATQPSAPGVAYLPAQVPGTPVQNLNAVTDSTVTFSFGTGNNSQTVEYAIRVKYIRSGITYIRWIDETGYQVANEVWLTHADWTAAGGGYITAQGLPMERSDNSVQVKARNGAGFETALTPETQFMTGDIDITPPTPDPARWDAGYTPSVTQNSIAARVGAATDNNAIIRYSCENITTGVYTQNSSSRDFQFTGLAPAKKYQLRARVRDGVTPAPNYTQWTPTLVLYTLPAVPGAPRLVVFDAGSQLAAIEINPGGNSDSAEYAIEHSTGSFPSNLFIAADGNLGSTTKAWLTAAEWLQTPLTGLQTGQAYSFRVYARNGNNVEAGPGAAGSATISFSAPTPNPPVLQSLVYSGGNVTATAGTVSGAGTVQYYFETVSGPYADSGWVNSNVWTFYGSIAATSLSYRVKARDSMGNETGWSAPKSVTIPPAMPKNPIVWGSINRYTAVSIDLSTTTPGVKNSRNAQFAIRAHGSFNRFVNADGGTNATSSPVWLTYEEWGEVVHYYAFRTGTEVVSVLVRIASGTTEIEGAGTSYTVNTGSSTPISPAQSYFEGPLNATATTVTMKSVAATTDTVPEYGFQRDSGTMLWQLDRTYVAEGLAPATTYVFRTQARDGSRQRINNISAPVSVTTLPRAPGPPQLTADAYSIDLQIDWQDNPAPVEYTIIEIGSGRYVAADGTISSDTPVWRTMPNWGLIVHIPGLESNTKYEFAVKARATSGESDYSPSRVARTTLIDNEPPQPDPMGFEVYPYAVSATSFRVVANEATDDSLPVEYYFDVTSSEGNFNSGWQVSPVFEPQGLMPGGKYTVTVTARDSNMTGPPNVTQPSASADVYLPVLAPGQPVVHDVTAYTATVSFNAGAQSADARFALREQNTGKYVDAAGNVTSLVPVWRTAADWQALLAVVGLRPSRTYYFASIGRNTDELMSSYSAPAAATTLQGPAVSTPDAPTILHTGIRTLRLELTAGDRPAHANYVIKGTPGGFVQADGTLGPTEVWQTLAQWGNPLVRGLQPDSSYQFEVMAEVDAQESDWSTASPALMNINGDTTGDGAVNILDLIFVRNRLGQNPAIGLDTFIADVNDDGVIDDLDLRIVRSLFGNSR